MIIIYYFIDVIKVVSNYNSKDIFLWIKVNNKINTWLSYIFAKIRMWLIIKLLKFEKVWISKKLNIKEIEYLCTVKIEYYLSPEEVFKYLLFCTLKYKISTVSNTN